MSIGPLDPSAQQGLLILVTKNTATDKEHTSRTLQHRIPHLLTVNSSHQWLPPPSHVQVSETSSFRPSSFWPTFVCLLAQAKEASAIWRWVVGVWKQGLVVGVWKLGIYQLSFPRHWQLWQRSWWTGNEELFSPVTILNRQQEACTLLPHLWCCLVPWSFSLSLVSSASSCRWEAVDSGGVHRSISLMFWENNGFP